MTTKTLGVESSIFNRILASEIYATICARGVTLGVRSKYARVPCFDVDNVGDVDMECDKGKGLANNGALTRVFRVPQKFCPGALNEIYGLTILELYRKHI